MGSSGVRLIARYPLASTWLLLILVSVLTLLTEGPS
jgi:hypothetical protein